MGSNLSQPFAVEPLVDVLRRHLRLWLLPTLLVTLLATLYALFRSEHWVATQCLAIRNDAANNLEGPGRFRHIDDMKVPQATLLEVAKSRSVLAGALQDVGPEDTGAANQATWPAEDDIAALRDDLAIAPPKGAEFGKTEVLYLSVQASSPERSVALVSAICTHLQQGLRQLRQIKAQSMIDELAKSVAMTEGDLSNATQELAQLEQQVGADLGELRMLDLSATGDSDLRRKLGTVEVELRQARTTLHAHQELLALLQKAQKDPGHLLATPQRLLESQPALRKLKEGLMDAQLRTAQFLGTMTENHPQSVAARQAQAEVSRHLHDELAMAIRGVEMDVRLESERCRQLEQEESETRARLDWLAGQRARYSLLTADVRHRTQLTEKAQSELTEARAAGAAAVASSLLSLVDVPEVPTNPSGPATATIVLAGFLGGLTTGFGLVFLLGHWTLEPGPSGRSTSPRQAPAGVIKPANRTPLSVGGLSLKEALAKVSLPAAARN